MTEPEDTGSKPEPTEKPAEVWLPPRLRQKLEEPTSGEEFDFLKQKSSPVGAIVSVVVIVAVLAGAWWIYQNNKKQAAARAAAEAAAIRAAFVADSLLKAHVADSLAAVARADSIAFAALPKWKQRQILAERAKKAATSAPAAASTPAAGGAAAPAPGAGETPPAEPETPAEPGPFGIDAGQFLDEERANTVAAELKEKTGLAASVIKMGEGEEVEYHVVLGNYTSRGTAESKANSLLGKGVLPQAAVIPLPKAP